MAAVKFFVVGVNGDARRWWTERGAAHGLAIEFAASFDTAVAAALDRLGVILRRRA